MAGDNLLTASTLKPKVLASMQLADTSGHSVYSPPNGSSAIVKHGTLCNIGGATVNATVAVVPAGGIFDGTHRVMSAVPIAAGDSFPLKDYLGGACLGPGDAVYVQASVANVLDVILTGTEAS